MKKRILGIALLICTALLAACGPADVTILEGTERDAVLAYSEPAADNLFTAINNNDFAGFHRDFDTSMLKAMDEAAFGQIQNQLLPKIGKYVSRQVKSVELSGKYHTVIYEAVFEQDDPVTVRLVFNSEEDDKVSGLWFDSAKLRQK